MDRLSACVLLGFLLFSAAGGFEMEEGDLKVGGYVDRGRFQLSDSYVDGEAVNRMGAKWRIDKRINDRWTAKVDLHWMFWRNQATDLGLFHIAGLKFDSDLQGSIAYRNGHQRVKGGLYDFKYNRDSKNLGEYLLRTEAYPTIVENSQGKDLMAPSFSRVAGFEYGLDFPLFRQTGLVYAEQYNIPVNDISLVYLAGAGPESAELGFGVSFHRWFGLGKPMDATILSQDLREYVDRQGLETRAVKLGLRGRLDLGALLGLEQGFRLYAEAALLGLKADSLYYRDRMQRLPVMAGVDLPSFGLLTVLSVEAEYFRNPYFGRKYSMSDITGSNFSPLPYIDNYADLPQYSRDDWKWSVLAHKALNQWLDVKLRFASDHLRLMDWSGDYMSGEPMTRSPGDWYFLARIEYHN